MTIKKMTNEDDK